MGRDKPLYKKGVLIYIALPPLPPGEGWEGQEDRRNAEMTRDLGPQILAGSFSS